MKPFLAGALGAMLGASSMMVFASVHGTSPAMNVAVASEEDDQSRIIEAVKRVEPSVVALDVDINGTRVVPNDPLSSMFGGGDSGDAGALTPFHEQASGSGFVFSNQGLILTNDHVVHGASKITVVFANGDRVAGHIFSENSAGDLALVKVDHYRKLPAPVTFGSSRAVQQGEWAIAIGEPFALKQTVTVGVVSGFNRDESIGGQSIGSPRQFKGMLQTSAPINPGNSGGPLIDMEGRVIGVNQSVAQPAQNIGFAIPVDNVKRVVATLAREPGSGINVASGGFIGVQLAPVDASVRSELNYQGNGAAIAAVVGGSPADRAGLAAGDVIQTINNKPIASPADVTRIIHALGPGKTASLVIWNGGTRSLVAVHIGTMPDQSDD